MILLRCFLVLCLLAAGQISGADDWPQWRGPNRDGVWTETGIIDKFDAPEIKLKWKVPIAGGYTGPTVADGRVYVMDRVAAPKEIERALQKCLDELQFDTKRKKA